MIAFDSHTGYLSPGIHALAWREFSDLFVWNERRQWLCGGLYRALNNLRNAGCKTVLIDGSFVTRKELPSDYDAAFNPEGIAGAYLDPVLIKHSDGRRAMKAKYFGDIFPWAHSASTGGAVYIDFFQTDRDGVVKGIVAIDLGTLP
jgi:hypothetical protein